MIEFQERVSIWLAWRLPPRIAYWAHVRVATSSPEYSEPEMPALTCMEAMQRFGKAHGWEGYEPVETADG